MFCQLVKLDTFVISICVCIIFFFFIDVFRSGWYIDTQGPDFLPLMYVHVDET